MAIDKTNEKFESGILNVGDRFCEMFSYWVVILKLQGDEIITIEGGSSNLEIKTYSHFEVFKSRFSYDSIPGYWITYIDNNTNRLKEFVNRYKEIQLEVKKNNSALTKAVDRDINIDKLLFDL